MKSDQEILAEITGIFLGKPKRKLPRRKPSRCIVCKKVSARIRCEACRKAAAS